MPPKLVHLPGTVGQQVPDISKDRSSVEDMFTVRWQDDLEAESDMVKYCGCQTIKFLIALIATINFLNRALIAFRRTL